MQRSLNIYFRLAKENSRNPSESSVNLYNMINGLDESIKPIITVVELDCDEEKHVVKGRSLR